MDSRIKTEDIPALEDCVTELEGATDGEIEDGVSLYGVDEALASKWSKMDVSFTPALALFLRRQAGFPSFCGGSIRILSW